MNESLKPTSDLAPDYYLHNFRFMLDWVCQSYVDLLHEHEHRFTRSTIRTAADKTITAGVVVLTTERIKNLEKHPTESQVIGIVFLKKMAKS
jgi:hypothetical protein